MTGSSVGTTSGGGGGRLPSAATGAAVPTSSPPRPAPNPDDWRIIRIKKIRIGSAPASGEDDTFRYELGNRAGFEAAL